MDEESKDTKKGDKKRKKEKKEKKKDKSSKKSKHKHNKSKKESKKRKKHERIESKSENDRPKKKHKKDSQTEVKKDDNDKKRKLDEITPQEPPVVETPVAPDVVPEVKKPIDDRFIVGYPLSIFVPGKMVKPFYDNEELFQTCVSMFRDIHFKFAFCNDIFDTQDLTEFKQQIYDLGVNKMMTDSIDWAINIVANDEKFHNLRDSYLKLDYDMPTQPKRKKSNLLPYFNVRLASTRNPKDTNYLSFKFNAVALEPSKGRKPISNQFDEFGSPIIQISHMLLKNVFVQSMILDSTITNAVEDAAMSIKSTYKNKLGLAISDPEVWSDFSRSFIDTCRYKYPIIPISSTDIDNCTSPFYRCTNSSNPNVDILTAGNASVFFPTFIHSKFIVPVFKGEESFSWLVQSIVGKKVVTNTDTILRYESTLGDVLSKNKNSDVPELEMVNYPFAMSFLMHFIVQVIQEPKYTMGQNNRGFVNITDRKDPYVFSSNKTLRKQQQQSASANTSRKLAAKTLQTRNTECLNKLSEDCESSNTLIQLLANEPAMISNRLETFLQSCLDNLLDSNNSDPIAKPNGIVTVENFLDVLNSDTSIHQIFSDLEALNKNVDDVDQFMESVSKHLSISKMTTLLTVCSSMGLNNTDSERMLVLLKTLKQKWDMFKERELQVKFVPANIESSSGIISSRETVQDLSDNEFSDTVWSLFKDIRRQNQTSSQNSLFYEENGVGFYGTQQMFISSSEYANSDTTLEATKEDNLHKFSTSQWAILTLPDASEYLVPTKSTRIVYDTTYHGVSLCANNSDAHDKKDAKKNTSNPSIGISVLKPAVIRKLINLYSQECKIINTVYAKFQELHSDISNALFFDFPVVQAFVIKNLPGKVHNGNRITCLIYEMMLKLIEKLVPMRMASLKEQENLLKNVDNISSSTKSSDDTIIPSDTRPIRDKIETTMKLYAEDLEKLKQCEKVIQEWMKDTKNEFGLYVQCSYSLLENIYHSNDPKQVILSMISFTLITKFNSSRKACEFTKDFLASYIPYATQKLTPGLGNIACNHPHINLDDAKATTPTTEDLNIQAMYPNFIQNEDTHIQLVHKHNVPNIAEAFNNIFSNTLSQSTADLDKLIEAEGPNSSKVPIMNTIKYMEKRMAFMEAYMPTTFQTFMSESENAMSANGKRRSRVTNPSSTPLIPVLPSSSALSSSSSTTSTSNSSTFSHSFMQYVLMHHQHTEVPGIKNSCRENTFALAAPFPFVAYSLNWALNGMKKFKTTGNFEQITNENTAGDTEDVQPPSKKQKRSENTGNLDSQDYEMSSSYNDNTQNNDNMDSSEQDAKPKYLPLTDESDNTANDSIFTKKVTANAGMDYIKGARVVNLDLDEHLDKIAKHIYNVTDCHGEVQIKEILDHERVQSAQTYDQCIPAAIHHAQKMILSSMSSLMNKHRIPVELGGIISSQVAELPISCETKQSFFNGLDKSYSETNGVLTARKFSPIEQYKHLFTQVVIEHANNPGKYFTQRPGLSKPDISRNLHLVVFVDVNKEGTATKKGSSQLYQTGNKRKLTETLLDYTYSCFSFGPKIDTTTSYLFEMIQNASKNTKITSNNSHILNHGCTNNINDPIIKTVVSQQVSIIRPLLIACISEDFFCGITKLTNPSLKQKTIKRYGDLSTSMLGRNKLHPYFDFFINGDDTENVKKSKDVIKLTPDIVRSNFLCSLFLQTDTIYLRTRQCPFVLWIPSTKLHLPVLRGVDKTSFTRGVVTATKDIHRVEKIANVLKLSEEERESLIEEILVTEKRNTHHLTVKFSASQKLLNAGDKSVRTTQSDYRCHMKLSNQLYAMRKHIGKNANTIWSTMDLLLSTHLLNYIKEFMTKTLSYKSKPFKRLLRQSKYFGTVLYQELKEKLSKDVHLDFNFMESHSQVNHNGMQIDKEIALKRKQSVVINLEANETKTIDDDDNSQSKEKHKKDSSLPSSKHKSTSAFTTIPKITSLKECWLDLADIGFLTTKEDLFLFANAASVIMSFFFSTTSSEDLKTQFNIDDDVCGIEDRICTINYMTPTLSKKNPNKVNINVNNMVLSHAYINFPKLQEKLKECDTGKKGFSPLIETIGLISKDELLFEENRDVRNLVFIMANISDVFKREKVVPWINKKNRAHLKSKMPLSTSSSIGSKPSNKDNNANNLEFLDSAWMMYAFYTILDYISALPSLPFSSLGASTPKEKWVLPIASQIFSCLNGNSFVEENLLAKSINQTAKSRGKTDIIHSDSSVDDTQQTEKAKNEDDDDELQNVEELAKIYESRGTYARENVESLCNVLSASEKTIVLECVIKTIKYISILGNLLLRPPKDKMTIIERRSKPSDSAQQKDDKSKKDTHHKKRKGDKKKDKKKKKHRKEKSETSESTSEKKDEKDKEKKHKKKHKEKKEKDIKTEDKKKGDKKHKKDKSKKSSKDKRNPSKSKKDKKHKKKKD